MRNGIFTKFQSTPYKILITKVLEKVTLQWKGLADPTLIKGSKWTSSVMEIKTVCHLIGCNETNTAHLCDFCAKDTELESSQEETSHLRTSLQNTRPIILQSIEFMKPKERRNCSRFKGTEET